MAGQRLIDLVAVMAWVACHSRGWVAASQGIGGSAIRLASGGEHTQEQARIEGGQIQGQEITAGPIRRCLLRLICERCAVGIELVPVAVE